MRTMFICIALCFTISTSAKEWKSFKTFQKETQLTQLMPGDWLKTDRIHNTDIWQNANSYNLTNIKPQEYLSIKQRRDFYRWLNDHLHRKGHEVVWISMASYISHKLRLVKSFPYSMFTNNALKMYTNLGSEIVFNEAFTFLKDLFLSEEILKNNKALEWDKKILFAEQYEWLDDVYSQMDSKSLIKINRMAKGKFLYGLIVPYAIRFEGDVSNANQRYNYAVNKLRNYCKARNE